MNLRLLCLVCAIFVGWVPVRSVHAQSLEPNADLTHNLGEFDKALERTEYGAQVEKCVLLFAGLNEEEKSKCEALRRLLTRLLQEPTFCHGETVTEPKQCAALGKDCLACCKHLGLAALHCETAVCGLNTLYK